MRRYTVAEINSIATLVNTNLRNPRGRISLEQSITELENSLTPGHDQRIHRQLTILRYYLQELFLKISQEYSQPDNNYAKLLNDLFKFDDGACVVSFNYDTLFDECLGINLGDINSYVRGKIKLIKLHGSCDWLFIGDPVEPSNYSGDAVQYYCDKPHLWRNLFSIPGDRTIIPVTPMRDGRINYKVSIDGKGSGYCVPALASPSLGKSYICPSTHIEELSGSLDKVDRILIIGWRGEDDSLINKISSQVRRSAKIFIVVASDEDKRRLVVKFGQKESNKFAFDQYVGGFSKFIDSESYAEFMNQNKTYIHIPSTR